MFDPELGSPGTMYDGEAEIAVHNPTFERMPFEAVSAIVTEDGVFEPDDIGSIAR